MSWTEARTVVVRSITVLMRMAGEIDDCNCGSRGVRRYRPLVDDIGARLPKDNDENRALPVGEANDVSVFDGIFNAGDVPQAHRGSRSLVIGDNQTARSHWLA